MSSMDGRAAIVTGGTRGIGRAIARALLDSGFHVAIAGRTTTSVERATKELRAGSRAQLAGFACDVRMYADCRRLVEQAVAAFGRLDVLVNNAGIGEFGPAGKMTPETWDNIIHTNLSGAFYCTREAIPHLKKAGNSWIINIGSLAGKNPFAGGAAYNASKFGLLGFSEALMLDVRYDGIRVSCIMPGSVATEFMGRDASAEDWRIAPEDVARIVVELVEFPERSLPSRIEIRPTKPPRRG